MNNQEENQSIYDWDAKVAEVNDKGDMGIVLSKGEVKVALTSEDCYSAKLIKEETESRVYTAVVKKQIKFFDPQGIGFIPSFDTILGVYEDMCDAIDDVYDTLCSKNRRMETGKNNPIVDKNGNTVGFDYIFRYEDKETGASAFYEIEIKEQIITPKRNKQSHP